MQSIFNILNTVFTNAPAAAATSQMRDLSASEVAAVAGAPELGHDGYPLASAVVTGPASKA
jgi:hypothetical protein